MKREAWIVGGLLAGVLLGALAGPKAVVVEPLGTLFLRLIRMVIVPLIASNLIVALAGLRGRETLGKLGARFFSYLAASLLIALLIGVGTALVLSPGASLSPEARAALIASQPAPADTPPRRPSLTETLLEIVPSNVVEAAAGGNLLQVLFVSVAFGLSARLLPDASRTPLVEFFRGVAEATMKLVGAIMWVAPLGVFGLVAAAVGRSGLEVVVSLGHYVVAVMVALALHVGATYSVVLGVLARQSILGVYRGIRPAQLIAFGTCSTAAAIPVSLRVVQEQVGLSARAASFLVPLAASVGRDGSAIYQAVSVVFIAQVYGHELNLGEIGTLVSTAMLAAVAVASVPAAGFVNLAIILSALGLPLEGAALVLGVERPLDMVRTTVNVTGQLVGATYVASAEGEWQVPAGTSSA